MLLQRLRILSRLRFEMHTGATIEYRLALFGIPFGWLTTIDHWEPPYRFVDRQLRGPYKQWIHTHTFRSERHGTRMDDRVEYRLPLDLLGRPALPLIRHQLKRIFDYRESTIQRLLAEG
jgi:ligand-binding SRPBCC domain-containing protein